ncbi:hypothetical protein SAMN05192583_1456 [Sphingomonas gellani]|uniref:Uncharacterized protein n=1 Tax=Sphingomonas gellani TaxID=1166340 RepID=A0A1H8C576_9SPHN|nr:transcriptional regulator [Sphingomonas gellani]SEM90019.1 hypothetical protein SAMN05192583_1456 [Sphingomonas gellani]
MRVFLDFEASSLADKSYPIEVGWAWEDGRDEDYLIRPASGWTDWASEAQAIHGIARETLERDGTPHDVVARRMVEVLSGHDLFASAPSWDGKWLSALLRAAGLPRHALRLRDSEDARAETARDILAPVLLQDALGPAVAAVLAQAEADRPSGRPAHRALADAVQERAYWLHVRDLATQRAGSPTG